MEIRYMKNNDKDAILSLQGVHPVVNEFISMWTRWDNWEKHPPVIIVNGTNEVVGIHAHTFTQSGYCNSYYQWLHKDYRGQRLGGSMVNVILAEANKRGIERLKMKTPFNSDGYYFWTGFGLKPIAKQEENKYYLFDQDILGIAGIDDLIEAASDWMYDTDQADVVTADKRTINIYKKQNVVWLHNAWQKEFGNA